MQQIVLPISDHNVVTASVRLVGRFARNRWVRSIKNPRIDLQCLTTDPDIGREVATAVVKQLRERTPNGENVDETEIDFADAIVRTVELVIPRKRQKRRGEDEAETPKQKRDSRWPRQRCIPLGTTSKQTPRTPN